MTTVSLISAPVTEVSAGVDLLTSTNVFVEDISADLKPDSSTIVRNMANKIHGTCDLSLQRQLDWGKDRVRPWVEISADGETTTRWNMGVYAMVTPTRGAGETPALWRVQGYDLLTVLDSPYGSTYSAAAGSVPLTLIAALLTAAGETNAISQAGIALTLPAAKTWPIDQENTTLLIINELLAAIGYAPLWCDREGRFRSDPIVVMASKSAMWAYDADDEFTTTVGMDRSVEADFFNTPNRWVFIRDDAGESVGAEGSGIYTVSNTSTGPTSQAGRGRTINKIERLQATSQAALIAQGNAIVAADIRGAASIAVSVQTNPEHWHDDVVTYVDAQLGVSGKWAVAEWRLDLGGALMSMKLESI
jgi:hypothetical protein